MPELDLIALLEGKLESVDEPEHTRLEGTVISEDSFDEDEALKVLDAVRGARNIEKLTDDAVKVLLLSFSLPTEYKGSRSMYEVDGDKVREIRNFSRDPSKYRSLRSEFYSVLNEIAYKCEIGWALMHNRDVRPLAEVIEKLNALGGDTEVVEVIEALLPRRYLIRQISKFIKEKRSAVELRVQKKSDGARTKGVDREIDELRHQIAMLEEEVKFLESLTKSNG